jgi:TRAP-type C4-dicarboxylate transport system substrate-binding protein
MVVTPLALLAVLLVSRAALAQPAQTITLKVADSLPTTHYVVTQATKPWMDRVVQLSKTKVEFQYYPAEQLGKLNDMLTILRTGVADIVGLPSLPGDFPLRTFFNLPGLHDTTTEGSRDYQQMLKEGPLREEFTKKGIRPLIDWTIPAYEIFSREKSIIKPEAIKGMKVRSGGGAQDLEIETLGGVSVQIPAPDLYVAVQRGTVDAALLPYTSAHSYKLQEVCKCATFGARLGESTFGYAISEQLWQKLPGDVREAMIRAREEIITAITKYQDDQTILLASSFEKQGVQINRLSKDEQARWAKALEPVTEEWIKRMEAKGLPGQQVVDAFKKVAGR